MAQKKTLIIIVLSQFFCTSVWFATNAILIDLAESLRLEHNDLGYLTSAIQLGFIFGTLFYAIFNIPDRFSPSKVFFTSAVLASLLNLTIIWSGHSFGSLIFVRIAIGFFLAGIYPVGMKIAADHFGNQLSRALGLLVGALVLGTALPHLLKWLATDLSWQFVILSTSALSFVGGGLIYMFIPDGPYRAKSQAFQSNAIFKIFTDDKFRSAAIGYFGHMWELYAFWAFIPFIIEAYFGQHDIVSPSNSFLAFCAISVGSIGCLIAGILSKRVDPRSIAYTSLLLSGICCLLFPFFFNIPFSLVFIAFLLFWGMVVIADSPMFSTLVAQNAPIQLRGTALTIVNCIGFSITIVSIQLISALSTYYSSVYVYSLLVLGPMIGLIYRPKK